MLVESFEGGVFRVMNIIEANPSIIIAIGQHTLSMRMPLDLLSILSSIFTQKAVYIVSRYLPFRFSLVDLSISRLHRKSRVVFLIA